MNAESIVTYLRHCGVIAGPGPICRPLGGGVSSDIWLIDDGGQRFVVKRALPKLRVPDDWRADVSRNRHEQEYMDYMARFLPNAVPRILHRDPEHGFFTMEYLGPEFANWKTLLLAGQAVPEHAVQAAHILGTIHRHSWYDGQARARFATTTQFIQLRIDPYLITTGQRHPRLQSLFYLEAERLAATSLCLVHGDYSPKNIMIAPDRMVILDCEVAWFGDPAFDVAFLLNHLLLKALYHHARPAPFLALVRSAWEAYCSLLSSDQLAGLEQRICRLLLMLLLARVDGKSPVEYLAGEAKRDFVRAFVFEALPRREDRLLAILDAWESRLQDFQVIE